MNSIGAERCTNGTRELEGAQPTLYSIYQMKIRPAIRPVTQADVGRRAGVTSSTVSLALRNDPRIPSATQQKVRAAAKALGYKPDPVLSALVARRDLHRKRGTRANLVALLDDRWAVEGRNLWLASFLGGIETACARFGYNLDVIRIQRDLGGHRDPDRVLHGRGIRGLVLLPMFDQELPPKLRWNRYSAVAIGSPPPSIPLDRVGSDAFMAMHIACRRLRELGYRRIGLVNSFLVEQRLSFEWLGSIAKETFLPDSGLVIIPPHLPAKLEPQGVLDWVRRERPDAVVTNQGCLFDWLNEGGFRIPEKLGLVLLNRDFCEPSGAAGLSQHLDVAGESAVELLHTLLLRGAAGFPAIPREVLIRPHWVDGFTLRSPAS